MPLIPMKQTVTVKRGGGVDDWGNPLPGDSFTLRCRVDEGSRVISTRTGGTTSDETVVATAKILFDKLADIQYTDVILFTNELGQNIERSPKEINVRRMQNGKPVMTEVFI